MAPGESTRVPMLWLKHDITLESSLTLREVRERLTEILPRFAVRSGAAIPRFGFSLSRYYLGALSEERLTLSGPYGSGQRGTRMGPALSVQGVIAEDDGGVLIHITVSPGSAIFGLFMLCMIGLVAGGMFAALDRVVLLPLVLLIVFSIFGVVYYAIARLSAVYRLNELLECLEDLLNARRRT